MSTFSGLNSAYTGLSAARRGLDVVGQNVANVNTPGYTRQRAEVSAAAPLAGGRFPVGPSVGQGVNVDGIARLGSLQLDARVRSTAALAGFAAVRANAYAALEQGFNEPGAHGVSAALQEFSAAWQAVAARPGDAVAAAVLIGQADQTAALLRSGYDGVDAQWTALHTDLGRMTDELNDAAAQVAELNGRIRSVQAGGGNANELLDARSAVITTLAALSGATVRESGDGMVDVLVGGNALVSGDSARRLSVIGDPSMGAGSGPALAWAHHPAGSARAAVGGELGGAVSMLAPSAAGGVLAAAADSYNSVARTLADSVNALHRTGTTTTGTTGLAFFAYDAARPAQSLTVVPDDAAGIASGGQGKGPLDASIADAISRLGVADAVWSGFVSSTGAAARGELQQAAMAAIAANGAQDAQLANASVDLDEENINLLAYQHAYQGAARVMTAIDEMLDTLINRTGIVGR